MQEIYFLREGEDIKKISSMYSVKSLQNIKKIFGHRYIVAQNGNDDVLFVRNYFPVYEYTIKANEKIIDIMAMGYNAVDNGEEAGDKIILSKLSANRYIVQPLDTIENIATRFNTSVADIVLINNLKSKKLFVGQILWI